MELQFKKSDCACLEKAVGQVQNQELTQEIKLPDGMPDIGRILAAWGQVLLRGKEWRGDSIACSGGMMVWVLYAPEDGSGERVVDGWLPFQMKWELPEDTPEGRIRIGCLTRFVDARSVSARKIMVRAGAAALAEAYGPKNIPIYEAPEDGGQVELLKATYPVRLVKEAGEKTFLLDEDLNWPDSIPKAEKLIYATVQPRITDKKVLANKVVFRGTGNLHTLYRGEDGTLSSWDFELPFSQFAELEGEYGGDAQADFVTCVTSLEPELAEEGHLRLKCGLVCQYRVTDREMLSLVEDAYCPGRDLDIQWENIELPVILENRRENLYGEQTVPVQALRVADITFLADYPRQQRTGDGRDLEIPGSWQMLCYDEEGALQGASAKWEGQQKLTAADNTDLMVRPLPPENLSATAGSDSALLKMELPMEITASACQHFSVVSAVRQGEARALDPDRPSLILRRAGKDRLWDIAKESGSTMDAIRQANHLEADPAPEQMLLIPVS